MDTLSASCADIFSRFDGMVGIVVFVIDLVACFTFLIQVVGAGAGAGHGEELCADVDEAA